MERTYTNPKLNGAFPVVKDFLSLVNQAKAATSGNAARKHLKRARATYDIMTAAGKSQVTSLLTEEQVAYLRAAQESDLY